MNPLSAATGCTQDAQGEVVVVTRRIHRGVFIVVVGTIAALMAACGGGGTAESGREPAARESVSEDDFSLPPLERPKDCPKPRTDLDLANYSASWANEKGKPVEQFERCLAAPAGKPLTIAFENRKTKGTLNLHHNVSVYADPASVEVIAKGKVIGPGKSATYEVDPLDEGLYLFKCDLHPNTMRGVLEVR
jgi:hypothetical protein